MLTDQTVPIIPSIFTRKHLIAPASYVAMLLVAATTLWLASHLAVSHSIHAIEFGNQRFVHGSKLTCTATERGDQCEFDLGSQKLVVTSVVGPSPRGPRAQTINQCIATLGGTPIPCEPTYITRGFGPRGIKLTSVMAAFNAAGVDGSDWRATFWDRSDGSLIGSMFWTSLGIASVTIFVLPALLQSKAALSHQTLDTTNGPSWLLTRCLITVVMTGVGGYLLFGALISFDYFF